MLTKTDLYSFIFFSSVERAGARVILDYLHGGEGGDGGEGEGEGGKVVRLLLFIQMGLVPGQEGSGGVGVESNARESLDGWGGGGGGVQVWVSLQ